MAEVKIECPKCTWEPQADSKWQCSCGHVWNTFDTAARCPACSKQWEETICLSCYKWSLHLDWYKNLDEWLEDELAILQIQVLQGL
ncbi:MAG: hypothetical protein Sapg2KO_10640 [Saprospiraceae bacterium]